MIKGPQDQFNLGRSPLQAITSDTKAKDPLPLLPDGVQAVEQRLDGEEEAADVCRII